MASRVLLVAVIVLALGAGAWLLIADDVRASEASPVLPGSSQPDAAIDLREAPAAPRTDPAPVAPATRLAAVPTPEPPEDAAAPAWETRKRPSGWSLRTFASSSPM